MRGTGGVLYPATSVWSKINYGILDGGGYIQELPETKAEAAALFADLKGGHWLDLNTAAVVFETSAFNANENMVIAGWMVVEFNVNGAVLPWQHFDMIKVKYYQSDKPITYVRVAAAVLFLLMVVYWMSEEIRQCECRVCRRKQGVRRGIKTYP